MGKVLRGSIEAISDDPQVDSPIRHDDPLAIIVELPLILCADQVDSKTNEITALPAFIPQMAVLGVVFAFDAISTQKNGNGHPRRAGTITNGAIKGNQSR
ncbi:hypothetical protein BJP36_39725 [Moorena producens JHB]|uniref:Uncharacterized protein n=1 Tax=Moorena producens (strain JHB) TaxID=1454205 RepID=A0A9Q9SV48_MOOP1|nr:hypothetical protein [Moorena producens]WAN70185.1 hypothetical protein BJP36_39725 [Moorena producens JHB]